jgi:hypothetical protein
MPSPSSRRCCARPPSALLKALDGRRPPPRRLHAPGMRQLLLRRRIRSYLIGKRAKVCGHTFRPRRGRGAAIRRNCFGAQKKFSTGCRRRCTAKPRAIRRARSAWGGMTGAG